VEKSVRTLKQIASLHEKAARKLREAAELLQEASKQSVLSDYVIDPAAATDPDKPVVWKTGDDTYSNLPPLEAAATYINAVGRPVLITELYRSLLAHEVRLPSMAVLASALAKNEGFRHIKMLGWVTHTVSLCLKAKPVAEHQQQ